MSARGAEINVTRCLTAQAFDLQPCKAAVDGLIYRRRWIDGAVAPHLFIPALIGEVVGFTDQRLAPAPLFCWALAKLRVMARYLESSFLRALRSPPDSGAG